MSVSTPETPAAEWSLESAIRDSGFMDEFQTLAEGTADTPADTPKETPSETGRATDATQAEPKAETATEDSSDAAGDGKTYTKEQYERSRAEANRQRDLAATARAEAVAELERARASLAENEFQRGVLLRTDQLLEELILTKGHTTLEDKRAAQIQAYNEMRGAREQIAEADLRKVSQESQQQQWTDQQQKAAEAEARALFTDKAYTLQMEAGAAGVPTFDAKTSLQDVLFSDAYQEEIADINSLPRDKQEKAALRIYERAMREVRAKFTTLAEAKQTQAPAPQGQSIPNAPQRDETGFAPQPTVRGFNVDEAMARAFDPENFTATINANPHLRGR